MSNMYLTCTPVHWVTGVACGSVCYKETQWEAGRLKQELEEEAMQETTALHPRSLNVFISLDLWTPQIRARGQLADYSVVQYLLALLAVPWDVASDNRSRRTIAPTSRFERA